MRAFLHVDHTRRKGKKMDSAKQVAKKGKKKSQRRR